MAYDFTKTLERAKANNPNSVGKVVDRLGSTIEKNFGSNRPGADLRNIVKPKGPEDPRVASTRKKPPVPKRQGLGTGINRQRQQGAGTTQGASEGAQTTNPGGMAPPSEPISMRLLPNNLPEQSSQPISMRLLPNSLPEQPSSKPTSVVEPAGYDTTSLEALSQVDPNSIVRGYDQRPTGSDTTSLEALGQIDPNSVVRGYDQSPPEYDPEAFRQVDPNSIVGDYDQRPTGYDTASVEALQQVDPEKVLGGYQDNLRAQYEAAGTKRDPNPQTPFGATTASGEPITPKKGSTFSTYDSTLNGMSMVERANAFSRNNRGTTTVNRSRGSSDPSPFRKALEARERRIKYNQILSQAGAGPNKDISLRAAYDIINKMEGQRLNQEATLRGQDLNAETSDLNRFSEENIAANRQRVAESLGLLNSENTALDRESREELKGRELEQQGNQFDITSEISRDQVEATRLGALTDLQEKAIQAQTDRQKARSKSRVELLKAAKMKDAASQETFDLDTFEVMNALFNKPE